ncbi:MAG: hypothetical protein RL632_269 [Bacteroidota bacterium]
MNILKINGIIPLFNELITNRLIPFYFFVMILDVSNFNASNVYLR